MMTENKRFTLKGLIEAVPNICDNGEIMEQEDVVDLLNKQDQEIKRLKLVVSEVIDAIIDDARIQLNEEFLLFSDTFDSIEDMKKKVEENLKEQREMGFE